MAQRLSRTNPPTTEVIADKPAPGTRLLTKRDVLLRVNRSYPTLWNWQQRGLFPRAKDVHGVPMWVEAEIEQWIASLPIKRIKGDPQ
jgi:predicted DNA-binding transcriptional regulator AlpA